MKTYKDFLKHKLYEDVVEPEVEIDIDKVLSNIRSTVMQHIDSVYADYTVDGESIENNANYYTIAKVDDNYIWVNIKIIDQK